MKKILLLLFIFSTGLYAQAPRVLELNEAVKLGLAQSHTIQLSTAKLAQSEAKYQEAYDQTIPSLKFGAGYSRLSDITPFGFTNPTTHETSIIYPNIPNNYNSHLSLSEVIFSGFRLKYALSSQQLLKKAAQVDAAKDSQEITLTIINSLYNLYKIHSSQIVLDENLKQVNQHLDDAKNWETNGIVTHNEVLKWQLQVSNVKLAQLDLDNNYAIANYNLNLLLGLDGNQQLQADSASLFSAIKIKSFTEYEQAALQSRPEFQSLVLRQKVSDNSLSIAKNSYWPTISVGANDQYARPNQRIFPLTDEFKNTWDIGINLNFDLTNLYSNRHNIAEAKSILDQTKAQQAMLSDNIRSEINQSYRNYTETVERIKVLEEAVVQAEENERINDNKYRNQLSLQSDLLDAENALLKTKIDLVNTKADAELAYYRLLKTTGLLPITF